MKNFGSNFKIEKEVEPVEVYNNTKTHNRNLKSYNELMRLEPYQYALPSFKFSLAKKSLRINHPLKIEEKKQVIIVLLDFSGSMCSREKQEWVCALLVDRLKYVVKEECEIYFSYFLTTRNYNASNVYADPERSDPVRNYFTFQHVYDQKSALKFLKYFSTSPNGGDTELGKIVDLISIDIEKGKLGCHPVDFKNEHYKPELLAIADGQDTVKTRSFSWKTNAISILGFNQELKQMCLNNQGSYVDINDKIATIAEATGPNTHISKTISLEKYKKI